MTELRACAVTTESSLGRKYKENEHAFRSSFTRDRDRVVHASAFRKLEAKTQVFGPHQSDYYRTRLTHTIEVAQITRTLTRTLGLNEDCGEVIALSHDLGHPPFGHAGERALNAFLKSINSEYIFNHNIQGLRIVEILEQKYPNFSGLNLTYEVREAFAKHGSGREFTPREFRENGEFPCAEGQVADLSDAIAYNAHDLDDGLMSGLLEWESVSQLTIVKQLIEEFNINYYENKTLARNELVRRIVNYFVTDALEATKVALDNADFSSTDDVRNHSTHIATLSSAASAHIKDLRQHLHHSLYEHPVVRRGASKAAFMISSMCNAFYEDPASMPHSWYGTQSPLPSNNCKEVRVIDFVSSLTDASAAKMYRELFDASFTGSEQARA